jgi:hypothetical protein
MRRIAFGATLLLLAAGCGSSNSNSAICDNYVNALNALPGKYAACGTLTPPPLTKDQCVQAANNSGCTDSDKQKINNAATCVNNLPNCTPATQSTWATSFENCVAPLGTLSSNC